MSQHQVLPIDQQKIIQNINSINNNHNELNQNNEQALMQQRSSLPQLEVNSSKIDQNQNKKKKKCQCKPTKGCIIRIIIAACLVGFIIYLIVDFNRVKSGFESFIEWLQNNLGLGIFILIIIYIVATVLFVPGLLLTVGAGVALQAALKRVWCKINFFYTLHPLVAIIIGSLAVWVGAMFGSFLAMLLGRYLLRSTIEKKALKYRIFRAIDSALKTEGFKFTVLLRLCPLIPFSLLNYVFGLTSVSIKNYLFGGVGMIPGTVAYVYLGTTISNIAEASSGGFGGGPVQLGLIIGGSVLAVVAIVIVTIRAKKELNKIIKKEKDEEQKKKKQEQQEKKKAEEGQGNNQNGEEGEDNNTKNQRLEGHNLSRDGGDPTNNNNGLHLQQNGIGTDRNMIKQSQK